jgi:hypothetical protein
MFDSMMTSGYDPAGGPEHGSFGGRQEIATNDRRGANQFCPRQELEEFQANGNARKANDTEDTR